MPGNDRAGWQSPKISEDFHDKIAYRFVSCLGLAIAVCTFVGKPAMAGCNSGNNAQDFLLTSGNCQSVATGSFSLAVGPNASAKGNNSIAIGSSSGNTSAVAGFTAIGAGALVGGEYSTAIGGGLIYGAGAYDSRSERSLI
jgi:hypothetical protein